MENLHLKEQLEGHTKRGFAPDPTESASISSSKFSDKGPWPTGNKAIRPSTAVGGKMPVKVRSDLIAEFDQKEKSYRDTISNLKN